MTVDQFKEESKPNIAHILGSSITYPLSCSVCLKTFTTWNNLERHKKKFKHTEENYPYPKKSLCSINKDGQDLSKPQAAFCDLCQKMFGSARRLKMHIKGVHVEDRPYLCSNCPKSYKTKNALTQHQETHTRTLIQCEVCLKFLGNKNTLEIHMKRHNQEYVTKCEQCEMKFVSMYELKTHMAVRHSERILCCHCGQEFSSKNTLKYHMKKHDPHFKKGTYKCRHCDKVFDVERNLKRHIKVRHDNFKKEYCCDLCGKVLTSSDGFKMHQLYHRGEKPLSCNQCEKRFLRRATLKWHMRTHTGEKPHECSFCEQAFTQPSALKRHMVGVHALKCPFICSVCGDSFSSKILLNDHTKAKHPESLQDIKPLIKLEELDDNQNPKASKTRKKITNISCQFCQKVFSDTRHLKKHLIVHSEDRPYKCQHCDKTFKSRYQVKTHIARVHNGQERIFECDFCLMKLKSKGSLTIHRKRHLKEYVAKCEHCDVGFVTNQEYINHMGSKHGPSNHVCNVCGRACYDKAALQGHMARHAEDYGKNSTIRCDICDKTFLQEKYLKHHFLRMHQNGGQQFICDLCGKKVNSKRSLRDHMYIHQGLKPLECKDCGKSFALRTTLKLHIRTHTGQRPYQCTLCGKSFTQRTPLTVHMRYHTGERPYECHLCDEKFVSRGVLNLHVKKIHGGNV